MKFKKAAVALMLATVMVGAAVASKVSSDYDRNTDFTKFKTYAWAESKNPAKDAL